MDQPSGRFSAEGGATASSAITNGGGVSPKSAGEEREGLLWPDPFRSLAQQVQRHFQQARGSHGWDHTVRVAQLSLQIGRAEGADDTVLRLSALLHDIGREAEDRSGGRICHAQRGAELAAPLVAPLELSQDRKTNIINSIRSHRYRGHNLPETLEAKVLFDADKLDSIGAVGIGRAFLFAGEVGARLHSPDQDPALAVTYGPDDTGYREYQVKLQHIRDRILTVEGRRLAAGRHAFMVQFFKLFLEEIDGKR